MAMVLGAFPAEYDARITTRIAEAVAGGLSLATWMDYVNVEDDVRANIRFTNYSGMADVPQWKDGEPLPLDEALLIGNQSLDMVYYGLGFAVTRQHVRYGEVRLVNKWAAGLARSGLQTMGTSAANLLNNAFTTTHTHFGTKTLCSTTHTTAGAGTRSNRGAGAALTAANWDTLLQRAMNWINYRGLNDGFVINRMVVPPALMRIAKKILGSDGEPGTANNDVNTHKGMAALTVEPKLTSSTAYFGMADGAHDLQFIFGQRPTPKRYVTDSEETLVHGLAFDYVTGIGSPDGVVGDAGA